MLNPGTAMARVLVDELTRANVTEAVVAPGSRSAPLAIALAQHPKIRLHVRIDERSAGFLALGLAKRSGAPVIVACTSGTAAANLHPAVLEAAHSHTPLIVLTCDRPPELRDTGVNQTIDQSKLYGEAVNFYSELGVAETRPGMNAYWRSVVSRGLSCGGPVHFNVPFRVPLMNDSQDDWPDELCGRPDGGPWTVVERPRMVNMTVPELEDPPERGVLVIAADAEDPTRAVAYAESQGWPILSEPGGNARDGVNVITTYAHLLAVKPIAPKLRPDLIVSVGKPGLVKPLLALYPQVDNVMVSPHRRWPDPTRTASRVIPNLPDPVAHQSGNSEWLSRWRRYEDAARHALDHFLDSETGVSELRVARDLARVAGADSLLFVGPSMPIRNLDLAMSNGPGPRVLTNRGVSGIDGCVSTAVGAALAHQQAGGGRAFALLGDLTFLHDQNGLIIGPGEPRPDLTLVVVNNDGGALFSHTPFTELGSDFERLFATPHGMRIADTAKAAGWEYRRLTRIEELPLALDGGSTRIVEIRTDRAQSVAQWRAAKSVITEAVLAVDE